MIRLPGARSSRRAVAPRGHRSMRRSAASSTSRGSREAPTSRASSASSGCQTPRRSSSSARPMNTFSGSPSSASRPSSPSTATRSMNRRSGSMRCSITRNERSRRIASAANAVTTSRAPIGSRFAVGSSSTSARGRMASSEASATRCLVPPDSMSRRRGVSGPRPVDARASAIRSTISSRGRPRFSSPNAISSSVSSITSCVSGSWNSTPTSPVSSASVALRVSRPPTVSVPFSQCASSACGIRPSRQSASVLFPAPLGPRRSRRSPSSQSKSRSRSAGRFRPMCRTVRLRARANTLRLPALAPGRARSS